MVRSVQGEIGGQTYSSGARLLVSGKVLFEFNTN
jgi:hypothetical protein